MDNKENRVSRLISTTEENWGKLSSILINLGISIPEKFNKYKYVNSESSLRTVAPASFTKLNYEAAINFYIKLGKQLGITFVEEEDRFTPQISGHLRKEMFYDMLQKAIRDNQDNVRQLQPKASTESVDQD